jgi:hypothetical protein
MVMAGNWFQSGGVVQLVIALGSSEEEELMMS